LYHRRTDENGFQQPLSAQYQRADCSRRCRGEVATQNRAASEIGAQVLRDGGSAIDTAVAMAFALTAAEPSMSVGRWWCASILCGKKRRSKNCGFSDPTLVQALRLLVEHALSIDAALAAPRIDVSGNPWITADARLSPATVTALEEIMPVVLADRCVMPNHFTIATGVADYGGQYVGSVEASKPWAAAIGAP
jgi:hypothetical protein